MGRVSVILTFLLLVLLGCYAWFYYTNTHVVVYDNGPKAGMGSRPFFAAEKFLNAHDIALKETKISALDFKQLNTKDTVFLMGTSHRLSSDQTDALLAWINNGGYLVVTNPKPTIAPESIDDDYDAKDDESITENLLLQELGIGFQTANEGISTDLNYWDFAFLNRIKAEPYPDDVEAQQRQQCLQNYGEDKPRVRFNETTERFANLPLDRAYIADDEYSYTLAQHESRKLMISTYYGEGYITLINDAKMWFNNQICHQDHAQLLLDLTDGSEHVWVVTEVEHPGLFSTIIKQAPYVGILLILSLLFWWWHNAPRFGPVRDPFTAKRRQLREHLEAHGSFMKKHHGAAVMLDDLRQMIEERIAMTHSNWSTLDQAQKIAHLDARLRQTGFNSNASDLRTLLFEPFEQLSDDQLIMLTRELQAIRKCL